MLFNTVETVFVGAKRLKIKGCGIFVSGISTELQPI